MTASAKRSSWPYKSDDDLRNARYVYIEAAKCRGVRCAKQVYWYRTPRGALMPIDPETFVPHFATCIDARQFDRGDSK